MDDIEKIVNDLEIAKKVIEDVNTARWDGLYHKQQARLLSAR